MHCHDLYRGKLYASCGTTCSRKVIMALEETGGELTSGEGWLLTADSSSAGCSKLTKESSLVMRLC